MRNMLRRFLTLLLGAVQFFLGMDFVLRLFGANRNAPFVRFIEDASEPLLAPFSGIFSSDRVAGAVFDFSILFALFAYLFAGHLLFELLDRDEESHQSHS